MRDKKLSSFTSSTHLKCFPLKCILSGLKRLLGTRSGLYGGYARQSHWNHSRSCIVTQAVCELVASWRRFTFFVSKPGCSLNVPQCCTVAVCIHHCLVVHKLKEKNAINNTCLELFRGGCGVFILMLPSLLGHEMWVHQFNTSSNTVQSFGKVLTFSSNFWTIRQQ